MYFARGFRAALVTVLVATACSEEPTTSVPTVDTDIPTDLALMFPEATDQILVQGVGEEVTPPTEPAGAIRKPPTEPEPPPPVPPVASEIWGARTGVGFMPGIAYSNGSHHYTGNVGRVETVAIVTFGSQEIGRQPAANQESVPYLLDFGRAKQIAVEGYVFVDQECGLRVNGQSAHFANWEWFLGGPAPNWGKGQMTTQAYPPADQPPCAPPPPNPGGGGSGGAGGGGDGWVSCWYYVTYDLETGEIVDARFLFCDDVIGG
jgi:hypothetical protein